MNYPKWCQISPDFQKSLMTDVSLENLVSHNNNPGSVYLRSLNLSPDRWSADRIAFYRKNLESDYQVKIVKPAFLDSGIEVIIIYRNREFQIKRGGQIITEFDGYTYCYDCLENFPHKSTTANSSYPISAPNSSTSFQYQVNNYENPDIVAYPEVGQFEMDSPIKFEQTSIYCFDFDRTLTSCHLTGKSRQKFVDLYPFMLSPEFIRWLFRFLIKKGKKVYIVTFSDKYNYNSDSYAGESLICEALSTIFDPMDPLDMPVYQHLRIVAYYPENYGLPSTKNGHLAIACRENNLRPEQCCLIDDNLQNIEMAKNIGKYQAIHTPNGITDLLL